MDAEEGLSAHNFNAPVVEVERIVRGDRYRFRFNDFLITDHRGYLISWGRIRWRYWSKEMWEWKTLGSRGRDSMGYVTAGYMFETVPPRLGAPEMSQPELPHDPGIWEQWFEFCAAETWRGRKTLPTDFPKQQNLLQSLTFITCLDRQD